METLALRMETLALRMETLALRMETLALRMEMPALRMATAMLRLETSPRKGEPARMAKMQQDETSTVLQALQKEVGKPNKKLLADLLAGTTPEALVRVGTTILSGRIVTDGMRIYPEAWAFWTRASPGQKATLRGFSQPLLALGVHKLSELRDLEEQVGEETKDTRTTRVTGEKEAQIVMTRAIALRDQAYTALRETAGSAGALRKTLDEKFGTADTAKNLAGGLDAFAGLLREWLEQKDNPGLTGRLVLASLDDDYAGDLEAAAAKVRATADAGGRRTTNSKATQANLDLEDGINVVILGQIIRAFERAHDLDPTIPRLVPISTRRLFNRKSAKKAKPDDEGTPKGTGGGEA